MKKSRLLGAAGTFSLAVLSPVNTARLVITAGRYPGDSCHFIVVSSTTRDTTFPEIAHYYAFAKTALRSAGL